MKKSIEVAEIESLEVPSLGTLTRGVQCTVGNLLRSALRARIVLFGGAGMGKWLRARRNRALIGR
jgi:hypothetical protein